MVTGAVRGRSSLEVPTDSSMAPGSTIRCRSMPVNDVRSMCTWNVMRCAWPSSSGTLA